MAARERVLPVRRAVYRDGICPGQGPGGSRRAGIGAAGRHPVLVAEQLASLAGLAPARVLPVFGLQPAQPAERPLFPVPDKKRAAVFDESLTLLRLLLTTESVTFHGEFFAVEDAR